MRVPCLRVVFVFALALGGGARASAQDTACPSDWTAPEYFQSGQGAIDDEAYEQALELFRCAYSLDPRPELQFNIGVCLEQLGRFSEALHAFEEASRSERFDEAQRRLTTEALERVRAELSVLHVEGSPIGAEVLIDGEARCSLPCDVVVAPGPHAVVVRAGTGEAADDVELARGEVMRLRLSVGEVSAEAMALPDAAPSTMTRGPGALSVLGPLVAAAGAAGVVGFGIGALDREAEYALFGAESIREEGLMFQVLANVSIGVAALGAIGLLVDLLFLAQEPVESPAVTFDATGLALHF